MAFHMHTLLVIHLVGVMEEMFELELVMITSGENLHVQSKVCWCMLLTLLSSQITVGAFLDD